MSHRWKRWAVLIGTTILLTVAGPQYSGFPTWANESPGGSEGEATLDGLRPPGPDDSGKGGGQTPGIRQGADPNDFTVTSPRRPNVPTEATRPSDDASALRNLFRTLFARLAALIRHS